MIKKIEQEEFEFQKEWRNEEENKKTFIILSYHITDSCLDTLVDI